MKIHLSLRTKGVLALAALLTYLALVALFVASQRQTLFAIVQEMEAIAESEATLRSLFGGLAHSIAQTQTLLHSKRAAGVSSASQALAEHLEPVQRSAPAALERHPVLEPRFSALRRAVESLRDHGQLRDLEEVRDAEQNLMMQLHEIVNGLQSRNAQLVEAYRAQQQFITFAALAGNIAGAVISVAVIVVFFTRLVRDIKRLQDRAVAIVAGYSGPSLPNGRRDEMGGLIDAVNHMQVDLRRSEQQREISREQRFHQEKMAAVGSLASAIGHEVSNPIAAISGMAEYMMSETRDDSGPKSHVVHQCAAEILKQTQRIAPSLHQMANLTAPQSPETKLLDLNGLIVSTCNFIRYDKRFARVQFVFDLDKNLPAVSAVADHITQILMNLLINSADALDHVTAAASGIIEIATWQAGGEVVLTLTDHGRGMEPAVLRKAFDESFTTKPVGKGRGIGLALCKSLIEAMRGRIELASTANAGTTATLHLPLPRELAAAA